MKKTVNVAGIFVCIWMIASMVGICLLMDKDKDGLLLVMIGQFFLVVGLFAVISGIKARKRTLPFLLFPIAGIGMIAGGLISQYGTKELKDRIEDQIPFCSMLLIFVIGVLLVTMPAIIKRNRKKRCTYSVTAKCVNLLCHGVNEKRAYCPEYEIALNGERIIICNSEYSRFGYPAEGEYVDLNINPSYPDEFINPNKKDLTVGICFIIGACFMLMSVLGFYCLFLQ